MKFGRLELDELGILALLLAMVACMTNDTAASKPAQSPACLVIVLNNDPDNQICEDCL